VELYLRTAIYFRQRKVFFFLLFVGIFRGVDTVLRHPDTTLCRLLLLFILAVDDVKITIVEENGGLSKSGDLFFSSRRLSRRRNEFNDEFSSVICLPQ
jgi:hypothetical protein